MKSSEPRAGRILPLALAALTGLSLLAGCRSRPEKRGLELSAGRLATLKDPLKLRGEILKLVDVSYANIIGTASTIAAESKDRSVWENTLRWKIRARNALDHLERETDPRAAYLTTWAAAVQSRNALTTGPLKSAFGPGQSRAIEVIGQLEADVIEVGNRHFGADVVADARDEVETLAASYPLTGEIELDEPKLDHLQGALGLGGLLSITQIPMAPVTGLQGVADTPAAIQKFSSVAGGFSDVVRGLPRRARWESELLLLELDSLDCVVKTRESFESISRSIAAISKNAETLPAELRAEIDKAITSANAAQGSFQMTLSQAREAAVAWQGTAEAVNGVLKSWQEISKPREGEPPRKPDEKSAAVEYAEMATQLQKASTEIRALLDDLSSGKLNPALAGVSKASEESIDRAADRADALVDKITARAAYAAAGLIVIAVVGILLLRKRSPRPARSDSAPRETP